MKMRSIVRLAAGMLCCLIPVPANAQTELTLKTDLLQALMNRVTVTRSYYVDAVGPVHPPKLDGEVHIAVRSNSVGFACVAEIMDMARINQESNNGVSKMIRKRISDGTSGSITGVWRF